MGITEYLLSACTPDKGGEGNIAYEVSKTERFDGDLDFIGSGERG